MLFLPLPFRPLGACPLSTLPLHGSWQPLTFRTADVAIKCPQHDDHDVLMHALMSISTP